MKTGNRASIGLLSVAVKQHILIAVDLIAAAKANAQPKYNATDQLWKKNGEETADFLSQANPNWPKATLTGMMATHLATTTKEVVARLNNEKGFPSGWAFAGYRECTGS
jgi:hypothetical protein